MVYSVYKITSHSHHDDKYEPLSEFINLDVLSVLFIEDLKMTTTARLHGCVIIAAREAYADHAYEGANYAESCFHNCELGYECALIIRLRNPYL